MKRRNWQILWLAVLTCASLSSAHATNMVYIDPASASVNPGDNVQFQLWMDFSDPVVTGGVDVTYTGLDLTYSGLEYGGFTWNSDAGLPWDDPV